VLLKLPRFEFGIVAPVGRRGVEELLNVIANEMQIPEIARACLSALGVQIYRIKQQILGFDRARQQTTG